MTRLPVYHRSGHVDRERVTGFRFVSDTLRGVRRGVDLYRHLVGRLLGDRQLPLGTVLETEPERITAACVDIREFELDVADLVDTGRGFPARVRVIICEVARGVVLCDAVAHLLGVVRQVDDTAADRLGESTPVAQRGYLALGVVLEFRVVREVAVLVGGDDCRVDTGPHLGAVLECLLGPGHVLAGR